LPSNQTSMHDRRSVGRRYGRHPRTIKRWRAKGLIPAPDAIIGDKEFWSEETLTQHDRQSTIARATATKLAPIEDQEPQQAL
jgi:hypothetical protein